MNFTKAALVGAIAVVLLAMIWAAQQNYEPALTGHCSYTDPHRGLVLFQNINDADPEGGSFIVSAGAENACLVNGVIDMSERSWLFNNGWSLALDTAADTTVLGANTVLPEDAYVWKDGYIVTKSPAGRMLRSVTALHTLLISFAFFALVWRAYKGI